jgi:hypothetical protein
LVVSTWHASGRTEELPELLCSLASTCGKNMSVNCHQINVDSFLGALWRNKHK